MNQHFSFYKIHWRNKKGKRIKRLTLIFNFEDGRKWPICLLFVLFSSKELLESPKLYPDNNVSCVGYRFHD